MTRSSSLFSRVFAVNGGLVGVIARVSGIRVERRFDQSLPKLEPETELAVYRIARESLTNVVRHSGATRVMITLERGPATVLLSVVDEGRGFARAPEEHGGLRGMRERAVIIGGVLTIEAGREGGVEVRVEVPVPRPAETVGAAT